MLNLIETDWQIKVVIVIICAVCKLVGETVWHDAQRFLMPLLFGIVVSLVSDCWWLGLTVLPMIGPITLGYKDYGPSNGFDRGCWLFVICLTAGLGCAILHHLSWFIYIPWCILAGAWGGVTRNWLNLVIAPITGAWIGSIIFLIH